MTTAYIVLESGSGEELAVLVNGALEQSWVLQGGINVCQMLKPRGGTGNLTHFLTHGGMRYTQALTKTDD